MSVIIDSSFKLHFSDAFHLPLNTYAAELQQNSKIGRRNGESLLKKPKLLLQTNILFYDHNIVR